MNWIKTKQFDLIFFLPVWFPVLFFVLAAHPGDTGPVTIIALAIYLIYHALIRLPHFFITYPLIYIREKKRMDWILYFLIPIFILALYFFFSDWKLLVALAVAWGWFHIGMQNYGFQKLYLRINQSPLAESQTYKLIFLGFILAKVLQSVQFFYFEQVKSAAFSLALIAIDLFVMCVALRLFYLKFVKIKERITTADYFFVLAIIMLLDWPRLIGLSQLNYFYLFNVHHCLAYLGISYLLSGNEKSETPSFKKLYPAMALVSIAIVLLLLFLDKDFLKIHIAGDSGFHPLFLGLFVVHYYLDGIAWKVRKDGLSLNQYIG